MWLSGGALVQPGETDLGFHTHTEQAKATHLGALDTSSPARCSPSLFDLWDPVSVQFHDLFSFLWQTQPAASASVFALLRAARSWHLGTASGDCPVPSR